MKNNLIDEINIYMILGVISLIGIIGWVMNLVKLIGTNFDPMTGMAVARILGVVIAPLGAVLGYM